MLIGTLLVLTWAVLLLRHPGKALPVSAAALAGLLLVALWTVWQAHREQRQLAHLELRLHYVTDSGATAACPADRPLLLELKNASDAPLLELRWKISAFAPGDNLDLAQALYAAPRYRGPGALLPGAHWQDCLPVPPLRPGYRPATLVFMATALQGRFAD